MNSPYHGNSAQHRAWVKGFQDRTANQSFNSGPPAQHASVTLAYNEGWRAASPEPEWVRRAKAHSLPSKEYVNA